MGSDKYDYKLRWLEAVHGWLADELRAHPELVVLGDFNIAPDDRDVHDPVIWNEDSILTSTAERAALRRLLDARPARQLPPAQRRGRPVQLVGLPCRPASAATSACASTWRWCSEALREARSSGAHIDREPRTWDRPSDHAPVWVRLG